MCNARIYALMVITFALLLASPLCWLVATNKLARADYNQVHKGMTGAEVEAILGEPNAKSRCISADTPLPEHFEYVHHNGDFFREPYRYSESLRDRYIYQDVRWWFNDERMIGVHFDDKGKVVAKTYKRNPTPGFWQRVRDWLGL